MSNTNYPFHESRPNFKDKLAELPQNLPKYTTNYVKSLFPITSWIGRYNLTWLIADLIAGLTVGAVVVPQGMGYAKVANLAPEFGLYTSFVGVCIYFFFATSKDITIGPTAVMSLLLGQTVQKIQTEYPKHYANIDYITALTLVAGIVSAALGFLRLGIIVDFIPGPVIASFSTGSAITIAIGQIYNLMGIANIDNKQAGYLVLGKTLGALGTTKIDAVMGILSLLFLYGIKYACRHAGKRWARYEHTFFIISIMRNIFIIVLTTIIAYIINIGKKTSPISILKTVPKGFSHVQVPPLNSEVIDHISSYIPIIVVILILEHVAIAKNFGRVNDYKINPSQEMIAIGVTNIVGPFLGGYAATGSFSRTAIKSKSGVRTPLAGIFSGILVVFALFFLTPAFYYIPNSSLAAVIIHAVLDLISPWSYVKTLYQIQFWDFTIYVVGVLLTFFTSIEIGVYVSTGLALLVLLVRVARPRIEALGRLPLAGDENQTKYAYVPSTHPSFTAASNPPEGVLIFRLPESLTYPNSNYIDDKVIGYAKKHTRRYHVRAEKKGDRPWNDSGENGTENQNAPRLRAIIFDMGGVNAIDSTGIQSLFDIRKELNKYADHIVEFHFANILNENIQNALLTGGFGVINVSADDLSEKNEKENGDQKIKDEEKAQSLYKPAKKFFHLTLDEAVDAATNSEWK
ncbi:741_t:CDS:2 [Ambispora leptoticha]|uniref:741_t:CDS:1 n=1 Tax=Ambispora leptoticha TaxID=144679 RepID=A0A9N9C188_9GLOM|nr:741_t:CDS:2 [Ambispora leptoticha]